MSIKYRQESFSYHENNIPIIIQSAKADGLSNIIPSDLFVHWHEDVEILYYKKSGGYVYVDGEIIEPKAGDIIIINPFEMHNILWGNSYFEYIYCIISPKIFASASEDIFAKIWASWESKDTVFCHHIKGDKELSEIIEAILEEKNKTENGYQMIIKGKLHCLVGILQRKYQVTEKIKKNIANQMYRSKRIKNIFKFVEENYQNPINSKVLAEKYGVCEEHFCRLFKRITFMTPNEYITKYRVMKSEELLMTSNIGMSEIAEKVGFNDANYFSRVFKKANGISPMKFRKEKANSFQHFSLTGNYNFFGEGE